MFIWTSMFIHFDKISHQYIYLVQYVYQEPQSTYFTLLSKAKPSCVHQNSFQCFITSPVLVQSSCEHQRTQDVPGKQVGTSYYSKTLNAVQMHLLDPRCLHPWLADFNAIPARDNHNVDENNACMQIIILQCSFLCSLSINRAISLS